MDFTLNEDQILIQQTFKKFCEKELNYLVSLLLPSFLRKQESSISSGFPVAFHLPGMTILLPELSNSGSPPAEPGVYLGANYEYARWMDENVDFPPDELWN